MKRVLLFILLSIITLLMTSCDTGCGCPGGAGYSENNIEIQHIRV